MFQEKSMLVDLTIHRWTATKHDKSVSAEVERTHSAKEAGRYNKQLIDKAHLQDVDESGAQIRQYHYKHTLPWTDKGARLLPSKLFFEYRDGLSKLKDQRRQSVQEFLTRYPDLVAQARTRLNTMFEPADYPTVGTLRTAFDVEIEIMPMPDAGDFRVDLAHEVQDEVRAQILDSLRERQNRAMRDCWQRVREVVGNVAKQCGNPKGRVYDSLMDNVRDLSNVLDGLNVTEDPRLSNIAEEMRGLYVPPQRLRISPSIRSDAARKAEQILVRVPA
jgi:hypothetical protein